MMRKNRPDLTPGGTGNTQGIWVTTYSDMMTNLMMFFLILWAYGQFAHARRVAPALPSPAPAEAGSLKAEIKRELEGVGMVALTSRKITLTLPSAVLFDPGSADLRVEAKETLSKVAASLLKSTAPVVVEGHTDDSPIRLSGWRSNYQLSAARSFSVIRHFAAQGVPPQRLTARGYGPFQPAAANTSDENRAKNRRIDIQLWMS